MHSVPSSFLWGHPCCLVEMRWWGLSEETIINIVKQHYFSRNGTYPYEGLDIVVPRSGGTVSNGTIAGLVLNDDVNLRITANLGNNLVKTSSIETLMNWNSDQRLASNRNLIPGLKQIILDNPFLSNHQRNTIVNNLDRLYNL